MLRLKRIAAVIGLMAALLLVLSSCGNSASQKALIGRWETEISDPTLGKILMVYRFSEEGEIFLEQTEGDVISFSIPFGEYEVKKNQITITSDGASSFYTFSVSETELIFRQEGEEALRFRRISS
ncbi:MAG: hypothetical protein IKD31_06945 [Clostridia bacterium]|nr:hypothetical protein [Clostridia bacterium]